MGNIKCNLAFHIDQDNYSHAYEDMVLKKLNYQYLSNFYKCQQILLKNEACSLRIALEKRFLTELSDTLLIL